MQISHEAIYRSLFIQTRGVLKKELTAQLRTARRMRHPKSHNAKSGQGHILDMVSIRERPAEIEDRAVPGHWGSERHAHRHPGRAQHPLHDARQDPPQGPPRARVTLSLSRIVSPRNHAGSE